MQRHIFDSGIVNHLKNFRLVQHTDFQWRVLIRSSWFVRLLGSLIGRDWEWVVANGRDRGSDGPFNYQSDTANNYLYHAMYTIPEIFRFSQTGKWTSYYQMRESLPDNLFEIAEIDLAEKYFSFVVKYGDDFMNLDQIHKVFKGELPNHLDATVNAKE